MKIYLGVIFFSLTFSAAAFGRDNDAAQEWCASQAVECFQFCTSTFRYENYGMASYQMLTDCDDGCDGIIGYCLGEID